MLTVILAVTPWLALQETRPPQQPDEPEFVSQVPS
jgi:hypothetical protein